MFLRLLYRGAILRPGRVFIALLSIAVAAAVATAMLTLNLDVQGKLQKEFRNYGANMVVTSNEGQSLPTDALPKVESALAGRGVAVPLAFVIAQTTDGRSVVVAGTELERARLVNRWWKVSAWPNATNDALVGTRALSAIGSSNRFNLLFHGRSIRLHQAGVLNTGASEDSRIYMNLADFTSWTSVTVSTIEIAATGDSNELSSLVQKISAALPAAKVKPIRQITEAESSVLGKTRSTLYLSAVLIILTAALCVLATLIGWVIDRRADFAIMKALGASEQLVGWIFAAEAGALGIGGSVLGFLLGVGVAMWIGQANFHAPVSPHFALFPSICAGSVAVALLSSVVPLSLLRRVQPAIILRGE